MTTELYKKIEQYMLNCMKDSAHDKEHIYRVLYMALDIAKTENGADKNENPKELDRTNQINMDVLIIACLLHDIGREEQFKNPKVCHARFGSEKAYHYLRNIGVEEEMALHIRDCILTHRFRNDNLPASIEAKILFDADKLDVAGTLGIARTFSYKAQVLEPLYSLDEKGEVLDGTYDVTPSFFQEYKFKLEKLYDKFYTQRGTQIAKERQASAVSFYTSMLQELRACYSIGTEELRKNINFDCEKNKTE